MADLPESVAQQFMADTIASARNTSDESRSLTTIAAGVLKAAAARNFDELGTVESKANSGVMATDMGGPTNAGK